MRMKCLADAPGGAWRRQCRRKKHGLEAAGFGRISTIDANERGN
jgi:hypothetical protein